MVVLNGAGNDLGCTRAASVDQNHEGITGKRPLGMGRELLLLVFLPSLDGNDNPGVNKVVRNLQRLIQETYRIIPEIEDQTLPGPPCSLLPMLSWPCQTHRPFFCRNSKFRPRSANLPKRASPRPERTTRRSRPSRKRRPTSFEDTYSTATKGCGELLASSVHRNHAHQIATPRFRPDERRDERQVVFGSCSSTAPFCASSSMRSSRKPRTFPSTLRKVATETAEPIKGHFTNALNKAA